MACRLVEHSENHSVTSFFFYIDGGQEIVCRQFYLNIFKIPRRHRPADYSNHSDDIWATIVNHAAIYWIYMCVYYEVIFISISLLSFCNH